MKANTNHSVRFNAQLLRSAERVGIIQKRSAPKQIEYWAEFGRILDSYLDIIDLHAIQHGLKRIILEAVETPVAEPSDVFQALEESRESGELAKNITKAGVYYEASRSKPDFLDRVDSGTGERQTGVFEDGVFKAQK